MKLAFYKGTSWVSKLIRWQTRGKYSHVGVLMDDGGIFEAWHVGGMRYNGTMSIAHGAGTEVDIYDVPGMTSKEKRDVEQFLARECGKGYDFRGVARFISHRNDETPAEKDRWFCSEVVMAAFCYAGLRLLNTAPFMVSPEVLSWSTRLVKSGTVKTK
jgi:uncharacterized protein YycO